MDPKRLQKARKHAKLTQEQLAKILGINRATISKYETGEISPPVEQMEAMANAFGITLGSLLTTETIIIPGRLKVVEVNDPSSDDTQLRIEASDEEAFAIGMQILGESGAVPKYLIHERLINAFEKLNTDGQAKAVERVEELAEIAKYRKNEHPEG